MLPKKLKLKRERRVVIVMNEHEHDALQAYCHRHRIASRSKFIREMVMTHISKRFNEDYPSLF